ncbi:rab5 GDP/GTP exchange factor [Condylostylus longicornis]|uniref:rab5 GDP/GTP exchange factor n=1 Tax=Condylostylus longicornis TaxID=2530218 RepID=UPI00244DF46A|nr:rab5 GDP/GTP exchange factor [Condylostylus longicornis]
MHTSKLTTLRVDHQDLKCRRGCGFYGNWTQFDGLCSQCFRERNEKQKKQKTIVGTSKIDPSFPKSNQSLQQQYPNRQPHYRKEHDPRESQIVKGHDSPSHRAHRESPSRSGNKDGYAGSLKKKPLLSVFNISSNSSKAASPKQSSQHVSEHSKMRLPDPIEQEFKIILKSLKISDDAKHKLKSEIRALDSGIHAHISSSHKNIDEISELVQNAYSKFSDILNNDSKFMNVSQTVKDECLDFFERVVMTKNHKNLFSPYFTNDEESDTKIQKRIRQLSWITAKHLACSIDEVNSECRDLVYNAITELVAMDSYYSPQEKLQCIIRCCRNVFALLKHSVGGPAGADEFVPALIFVILKANPVRLHSNINYISRFSITSRIMSGEGAYYFTNLCSATNFIEILNNKHLSLPADEFESLMSGERSISTPWESALMACESLHLISENMKKMEALKKKNNSILDEIASLSISLKQFEEEITQKIDATISKAPLTILPIKTPELVREKIRKSAMGIAVPILPPKKIQNENGHFQSNLLSATKIYENNPTILSGQKDNLPTPITPVSPKIVEKKHSDLCSVKENLDTSNTLCPTLGNMPNSDSGDLLFSSPIFNYTPFDNTPDDLLNVTDFTGGISNINYDFDLSDYSGENSLNEDVQEVNKVIHPDSGDGTSLKLDLEEFDPLLKDDATKEECSNGHSIQTNINENCAMNLSLHSSLEENSQNLIESDSPSQVLLPSPIKPTTSDYRGFSNFDIPSISCNTGDFSSINYQSNVNKNDNSN